MKTYPHTEIAAQFIGRQIASIRTRNRNNSAKPHVDIRFVHDENQYQLRTQRGWKICSVLLNTLRYQPRITDVVIEVDGSVVHLTAFAANDYVVCEFSARRLAGDDVAVFPFELIELQPGDQYVDVLARSGR